MKADIFRFDIRNSDKGGDGNKFVSEESVSVQISGTQK